MKVKLEFDCTPEEFRRLLGLPDVSEFNQQLGSKMTEAMSEAALNLDPEILTKIWFPFGPDAMADMQKSMWESMSAGLQSSTKSK